MAEPQFSDEELEIGFNNTMSKLDRPIPGQSLTNDPEAPLPFEQAPAFTDLTEVLEYYFATFTEEGTYENLLDTIGGGTPIMDLVQTILYQGFQNGLYNPDLMMLLVEPLAYMLAAFCEQENVEFEIQDDDDDEMEDTRGLPMMREAMKQVEVTDNPDSVPEEIQSLLTTRGEQ